MAPPGDLQPSRIAAHYVLAAATLQQVAAAAGVHRSTASRALNTETVHLISPEVATRVAKVATRLGYRRDMRAASLGNSRTRLIGMLVPDRANPVFPPILPAWKRHWPITATPCSSLMLMVGTPLHWTW